MSQATMTTKGQVTIPKTIRDRLEIEAGDRLSFEIDRSGRVILDRVGRDVVELRGMLHREGKKPVSIEEMDRAIGDHLVEKYAGNRAK